MLTVSDCLEKFAPSVTRKSRLKKRGQFIYNKEIAEAKQVRRQLERNCNKYRREIDRQLLKAQRNRIRSMAKKHKAHRISLKLEKSNPRQLFVVNQSCLPIPENKRSGLHECVAEHTAT